MTDPDHATERISQELARKERGLLKHDYASPCPDCGGVVFEWAGSETCQDCENDEADTEQTTLVTDGGTPRDKYVSEDAGVECDVDGCTNRIVGLDDGWEYSRGTVCADCIDYNREHGHWPDADTTCAQCHREAENDLVTDGGDELNAGGDQR